MSLLELRGAAVGEPDRPVLLPADVSLEAGERLVVFGGPGSGKHAFLKLAAGVLEPDAGSVSAGAGPVGYVSGAGGLLNNMTLLENAVLPGVYHGRERLGAAAPRARALLEELGAGAQAERRPAQATAAARKLAQFARALLAEPALFVLEDPYEDVDAATARTVRRLLQDIAARKECAAVVGTGRPGPYLSCGTRFALLSGGALTLFADRQALEADPEARTFL